MSDGHGHLMRHLHEGDVFETWCGEVINMRPSHRVSTLPSFARCPQCLTQASEYGRLAAARLRDLLETERA